MYNTENYIELCLDSVVKSSIFENSEVLVIDDGSTDQSVEKVKQYTKEYRNVFLYEKENTGVAETRNYGLNLARGKYVYFLDSDDQIEKEYIQKLVCHAEECQCDIVMAGYSIYSKEKKIPVPRDYMLNRLKQYETGIEFLNRKMDYRDGDNQIWCMLYRRSFLESGQFRFPSKMQLYEDISFMNRTLFYAEKVRFVNTYGYYYLKRPGCLVNSGAGPKERDITFAIEGMRQFRDWYYREEKSKRKVIGRVLLRYISMTLIYIDELNFWKKYMKEIKKLNLKRIIFTSAKTKEEKVKALLCCLDYRMFIKVLKIKQKMKER